LNLAF